MRPARAKPSNSRGVAPVKPTWPRFACSRARAVHLCAFTCGRSRAPGSAAVIVNPENVFDIARGMKEVLLDDQLRKRMVSAGLVQARKFSWERTAREVKVSEVFAKVG